MRSTQVDHYRDSRVRAATYVPGHSTLLQHTTLEGETDRALAVHTDEPDLVGVRDHGEHHEVAVREERERPEDRLHEDRPQRHDEHVRDEQRQLRPVAASPPGGAASLPTTGLRVSSCWTCDVLIDQ